MNSKQYLLILFFIFVIFFALSGCDVNASSVNSTLSPFQEDRCIDQNLIAMVCGFSPNAKRLETKDSPIDVLKNKQISELNTNVSIQQNLLGSVCTFESLDNRLQYKLTRSSAFINTFRIGVDGEFNDFEIIKNLVPISDSQCNINPKVKTSDVRKDRYMNYAAPSYLCYLASSWCRFDVDPLIDKLAVGERVNYPFLRLGNYNYLDEKWFYVDERDERAEDLFNQGAGNLVIKINPYFYRRVLPRAWRAYDKNDSVKFECKNSNECFSGVCSKDFYSRGVCKHKVSGINIPCDCTYKRFFIGHNFYSGVFCRLTRNTNEIYIKLNKDSSGYYFLTDEIFDFSMVEKSARDKYTNVDIFNLIKNSNFVSNCEIPKDSIVNTTPLEIKLGGGVKKNNHNVRINVGSGICSDDAQGLLLENYGWCEPCTYMTMATQYTEHRYRNFAELCPAYHTIYDELIDTSHVLAKIASPSKKGGGLFSSTRRYCDLSFSESYIGFGTRPEINCGRWPSEKWNQHYPHPGLLAYYLTKYLSQNVFPIVDIDDMLSYDDQRCRDSVFSAVSSHNSGNRGPVMLNFKNFTRPEEVLKRIIPFRYAQWYDVNTGTRVGNVNDPEWVHLKGCSPTCFVGLQVDSVRLGIYNIKNPQDYENAVFNYLESMLGTATSQNVHQKNLDRELDFIAIDFPAHRYYLWYQDLSLERAFASMLQFHANLSRKIYDRWQKFVIIKPLWGITNYTKQEHSTIINMNNNRNPHPEYIESQQTFISSVGGTSWFICPSILDDANGLYPFRALKAADQNQRVVLYMKLITTGGAILDNDEIQVRHPVRYPNWDVSTPSGTDCDCCGDHTRFNFDVVNRFSTSWYSYSISELKQGVTSDITYLASISNGFLGLAGNTKDEANPFMRLLLNVSLCEDKMPAYKDSVDLYWNEKIHGMFIRFLLENQRILTDSVTIGAILTSINDRDNPQKDVDGYPLIPIIWRTNIGICGIGEIREDKASRDKYGYQQSEVAKTLQKYGRLITGQRDMVLYTRHYAVDNCTYLSFADPSSPVGYYAPDPNCVLTNYTKYDEVPYCVKCSTLELSEGKCGPKYQVSDDGVFCKVPENADPMEYKLDISNQPPIPDDVKKLHPVNEPLSFVKCGLCKYNTSYGSCYLMNSFTGFKLAEYPFSPSLLKPWDMDIISAMYDSNDMPIYCCLIDKDYNPYQARAIYSFGLSNTANMTNYYTFMREVYRVASPETIIFSKKGTNFVNVHLGKAEYNINMFNFVRIDDERILECKLGRNVNISICYDNNVPNINSYSNIVNNLMQRILIEVPPDQRSLISLEQKFVERTELSSKYNKNCSLFVTTTSVPFTRMEKLHLLEFVGQGKGVLIIADFINNGLLKEFEFKINESTISYSDVGINISSVTIDDDFRLYEIDSTQLPGILSILDKKNLSSTFKSSLIVVSGLDTQGTSTRTAGKLGLGIYRFGRVAVITSDIMQYQNSEVLENIKENTLRYVLRFGR
ncbi:MAG: hypothetical protein N3E37_00885 [Candidatus Micrarchaeota archaeon]|nr:hypothetical protein [Candidatus Micrarchaeota archaeon]